MTAAAAAAASPSSHCVPTDADGRRDREELELLETAAMLCVQTSYALFCLFFCLSIVKKKRTLELVSERERERQTEGKKDESELEREKTKRTW